MNFIHCIDKQYAEELISMGHSLFRKENISGVDTYVLVCKTPSNFDKEEYDIEKCYFDNTMKF